MNVAVSRRVRLHVPCALVAAALAVLAWRYGGFHPRTWGWAALAALAWAVFEAARGRLPALRSPGGVAIGAMLALAVWSFVSISWAQTTRHEAWEEADRALMYAACLMLGATLLASARTYARYMGWIATSIAGVGLAVAMRMAFAEHPLRAFAFGRLEAPIGYANGLAAFAAIGAFLLLGIGAAAEQRARFARLRAHQHPHEPTMSSRSTVVISGATLAGAFLLAAVAQLAQSRGGLVAAVIGILVLVVAAPSRLAVVARLVVVAAALTATNGTVGKVFPALYDVRQAPFTKGADRDALIAHASNTAQHAAQTMLLVALIVAVVGAMLPVLHLWVHDRIDRHRHAGQLTSRNVMIAASAFLVAMTVTAIIVVDRSPMSWITSQVRTCTDPPAAAVTGPGSSTSHFADSGTGRCDYYRVAIANAREHPMRGIGAGNFQNSYIADRRTDEQPEVAHSLPLQLLSDLGLVGLALGAIVVAVTVWASIRFIGSGVARDPVFAGAIAAIATWLVHASLDWLWHLPAVTIPVMLAIGGLVACVSPASGTVPARAAAPLAAGVLILGIAAILPQTLADRAYRVARDAHVQRTQPRQALQAAQRASDFDPTWAAPHLMAARAQRTIGKRQAAADEVQTAVRLEPDAPLVLREGAAILGGIDDRQATKLRRRAARLDARAR